MWQFADVAYGAVIVWAYIGMTVKEAGTTLVPLVALTGAFVVGAMVLTTLVRGRKPASSRMVGVQATVVEGTFARS